ncbi:unnamed protein product [Merluccius merluccius]
MTPLTATDTNGTGSSIYVIQSTGKPRGCRPQRDRKQCSHVTERTGSSIVRDAGGSPYCPFTRAVSHISQTTEKYSEKLNRVFRHERRYEAANLKRHF